VSETVAYHRDPRDVQVYAVTPFAVDLNYGRACNDVVARLPQGSWACVMDHDMMFTTPHWYRQLQEAAAAAPLDLVGVVPNRCAAPWQRAREVDDNNHDVAYARAAGRKRLERRTLLDVTDTMGIAGVAMLFSKETWAAAGGFADGLLCVDHQFHYAVRALGRRVYLHEGVYVYHWRRAFGDGINQRDYPQARHRGTDEPCRCRGPERMPTRRVTLP